MTRRPLLFFVIFALFQFLLLRHAFGEYRVYRLGIKADEKQKKEAEVLTTLDDLQYVTYYRMTPGQQTRIIEHWMCRGRTDQFKKYCKNPNSKQGPPVASASATTPAPTTNQPLVSKAPVQSPTSPNPAPPSQALPQQNPKIMLQ